MTLTREQVVDAEVADPINPLPVDQPVLRRACGHSELAVGFVLVEAAVHAEHRVALIGVGEAELSRLACLLDHGPDDVEHGDSHRSLDDLGHSAVARVVREVKHRARLHAVHEVDGQLAVVDVDDGDVNTRLHADPTDLRLVGLDETVVGDEVGLSVAALVDGERVARVDRLGLRRR